MFTLLYFFWKQQLRLDKYYNNASVYIHTTQASLKGETNRAVIKRREWNAMEEWGRKGCAHF